MINIVKMMSIGFTIKILFHVLQYATKFVFYGEMAFSIVVSLTT